MKLTPEIESKIAQKLEEASVPMKAHHIDIDMLCKLMSEDSVREELAECMRILHEIAEEPSDG